MKKYLAITAALALVLTACGHAAPDSIPTLTAATETTQATAAPAEPPQGIGSGALRMLTAAADGVYYQAFNDWEINYTDTMGRALVYAIDEQTGDARPVCSLPGCAHDSAACPAWSDGNVTLCYGDGDEVYLLLFYYNDETSYYRWERISADHTQRTVLATIEPGQSVVGRGVAVDDVNLYYSLLDEDNRHQTLWAVDTAGGQMQRIYTWDDLADGTGEYCPEMYMLLEVSGRQIPYQKDKTTDERFFILSLFAIAEEIEAQGAYTSGLMPIDLAIGLPPAHFGAQNKAFVRYFKRKEPIYFSYRDKLYSILIRNVQCYPQAFAAAAMMLGELATVPRALILDVGGFTADYLLLKNGRADLSTCDSLENGVILLYNRIRSKASSDLDILLEETDVDAILLQGQGSSYGEEVAALVEYQAQEFVNDMLGALRERQLDLRTGRVIFVGGGACLLRRQIEASGKVAHPVFVEDVNANAKGFEYLYRCTVTGA